MPDSSKVDFSFGWLALKLLGKSLYSNAWSAISELVANGFDAQASEVYVYIDATDKKNAIIEIFDDGSGMDASGVDIYTRVGFNRRKGPSPSETKQPIMGRKGIGKLAALYLSENYYLFTKTEHSNTAWEMQYRENLDDEDERPSLQAIEKSETDIVNQNIWNKFETGTLLQLRDVNLVGLGEVAYQSLNKKLSNYFALDTMEDRKILLFVKEAINDVVEFKPVKKEIAFKNMAFIEYSSTKFFSPVQKELDEAKETVINIPLPKIKGNYIYKHKIDVNAFAESKEHPILGEYHYIDADGNTQKQKYALTGWIGFHSTIDNTLAQKRDLRFTRTKFYNPIQLRLYVRNKLAIENFLTILNQTQAFVNYVEGEIHFDILDDDDLPDIATSNRQGMDEHDPRIQILRGIVSQIVTRLITKRNQLTELINKEEEEKSIQQKTTAKKQFSTAVIDEFNRYPALNNQEKSELALIMTNKIEGEITPKSDFKLFFSHSRQDKCITDFFYHLLKKRGVADSEIFYTSKTDNIDQYENLDSLSVQIKDCIIRENTMLAYFTSKDYKESEYCMFEGGAGWATRAIGEYSVFSLTYAEIPKFITNGKLEFCIEQNKSIILNREAYLFIVNLLNKMIRHINQGRELANNPIIDEFVIPEIPNELELEELGKTVEEYFDLDLKKYWDYYVGKNLIQYTERRYPTASVSK